MHSIWQEQIDFPSYPILKRDKKTDILYVGATLKHAVEAHFQKESGNAVMIIEEKSIGDMPELGGMGILKATNMNEFKDLCILRNYIIRQHIPCDLEIISETSIQVHPVKLFLFMTKDVEVYEQTKITARQGKRLDIESAYIDAAAVCGNTVVAYSSDPKIDASFMETNSQKIIRKNGYKVTVKIFTDLRPFLERLDSMNDHRESLEEGIKFTPDEKYPDLSRNELIRQTILALCL